MLASHRRSSPRLAGAAAERKTGALPRGGSYVMLADATVASAAVGLWFRAPGAGYDNASPGISNLAATAAAVAPLACGKSLFALVHSFGGDLNINVYPDIVSIDAIVPATAVRRIVAAMTAAYFAPSMDDVAVKTAQRERGRACGAAPLRSRRDAARPAVRADLLRRPGALSAAADERLGSDAHHDRATSPTLQSALSLSRTPCSRWPGNVDGSSLSAVTDGGGPGNRDAPIDSTLAAARSATASGAIDGLGLAWVGPPISDEKAATAMDFIADYLFRDKTGLVSRSLAQRRQRIAT